MKNLIEVEACKYSYPDGTVVLKGVDLRVKNGETFGLAGLSGSGKTTLMKSLCGLITVEGIIRIGGDEVCRENLERIRKRVGIVFQNPEDQLFCPTVEEDVAFGLESYGIEKEVVSERVLEVLKDLDIEKLALRSSWSLSAGERKLAAIATVLVMKPEVIIFDEPFANLDYSSILSIVEIIGKLDATIVLISQDILILSGICDRIGVMRDGIMERTVNREDFNKHVAPVNWLKIREYAELFKNFL